MNKSEKKLGQTVLLWECEWKKEAYVDQVGIAHPGYVVRREFPVKITEVKENVPYARDLRKTGTGFSARDTTGTSERIFYLNYSAIEPNEDDLDRWYDGDIPLNPNYYFEADQAFRNQKNKAFVTRSGAPAIPKGINRSIWYCPMHNTDWPSTDRGGCPRCAVEYKQAKLSKSSAAVWPRAPSP